VNLGQSSNDVIPSALHIAAMTMVRNHLLPALDLLARRLREKASAFADVTKIGRTHLQDAVPITLGREFGGYARQVELGRVRVQTVEPGLCELALGGSAVGTGLNTHPEFAGKVIAAIAEETGCPFKEAVDHFEAQAARDAGVELSGTLKTLSVGLLKIANDIRWLSSGPRCGLGEIHLPALQPGSSIMPGKVNPVIPEVVVQAASQVIGNDAAVTLGGQGGNFELNAMLPLIAYNVLQSISLLGAASTAFAERCIQGITANEEKCRGNLEWSLALATAFVPLIGYDEAASLAKEAYDTNKTVREVALSRGILPEEKVHEILDRIVGSALDI
jgi:fumarate hydratase class II